MDVLSHLKKLPKDVFTFQISPYSVALEGWRRGLTLRFLSNQRGSPSPSNAIRYSLSDGTNEYTFACARGSIVTKEAIDTCIDKARTYSALKSFDVPIPEGKSFQKTDSIEDIYKYGESLKFPLVVKATNLGGGRGVFANITTEKELKKAITTLRGELERDEIIVERFFEGTDYRFHVVGDKVSAVAKYYSLNIVGDGENTIEQLINIRNKQFKENRVFKTRNIKVDKEMLTFLEQNNYTLDSVPSRNERVFLREQGTYIGSRLAVDVTDDISEELKNNAIDAIKSIPGLYHGSVDMIVNEETGLGVVNEVNSRGEISLHLYPIEGKARDVPKDIIDYYFPNSPQRNENFYFEYKPIKELFLSGYATEVTIPKFPDKILYKKSFNLEGSYFGPIYMKWVKREAAQLGLIGEIKKNKESSELKVTAVGTKNSINKFESIIKEKGTKKSLIRNLTYDAFSKATYPINISFEIKD